jgi:AcrR family transcriptional regulator
VAGVDVERPYHHGHVRDAAVAEALRILATDGPDAITLRGVARATGLSHTAVGKEFGGLPAFFAACAATIYRELERSLRDGSCGHPDPLSAFRAMGSAYLRFAMQNPGWLGFLGHPLVLESPDPALRSASRGPYAALRELVEACQAAGLVRGGPADHLALLVWSTVHGFAGVTTWGPPELLGARTREEWAETLLDELYFGLAPGPC